MFNQLGNPYAFKEQPNYYQPNPQQGMQQPPVMNSFQGMLPNQLSGMNNSINQMDQYQQPQPYSQPFQQPFPMPKQQGGKEPGQYGMMYENEPQQLLGGSRGGGTEGFSYLHQLGVQPSFGLMSQTMGAPQTYNPFNSGLSQQR